MTVLPKHLFNSYQKQIILGPFCFCQKWLERSSTPLLSAAEGRPLRDQAPLLKSKKKKAKN